MKLGARTSTIHINLCQPSEKKAKKGELEIKVAGYITVSPSTAEVGISSNTGWDLQPAAQPGTGPNGSVNLAALGQTGRDGKWVLLQPPYPKFRRATLQLELYGPDPALGKPKVIDQWSRFRPGGDREARWTNEAVAFLVDMFPMALGGLTKVVRDGRTDLNVVILDEQGDVVALSTQVGLVLSASRNLGQRQTKI